MMKPTEILRDARKLIAEPQKWTTRSFARTASGEAVSWGDPNAVCFCSLGAIYKAADGQRDNNEFDVSCSRAKEALCDAITATGWVRDVINFNDAKNHEIVLSAFDRAIAIAEATETAH